MWKFVHLKQLVIQTVSLAIIELTN